MTQALSGGAVALVLLVLWLLRRPRPQLMRSTDGAAVAALNRIQMELVVTEPASGMGSGPLSAVKFLPEPTVAPGSLGTALSPGLPQLQPRSLREVNAQLASLKAGYALGGPARRQALETCLAWGHRSALPLLHLGLRDADPVVAGLAARGLDRFRGRSGPSARPAQAARLPRNVARTR
jgi:hypothetical protein